MNNNIGCYSCDGTSYTLFKGQIFHLLSRGETRHGHLKFADKTVINGTIIVVDVDKDSLVLFSTGST